MTTAIASLPSLDALIGQLQASQEYFDRSTSTLLEQHSTFAPKEGAMTVAAQIMHTALTLEWFLDGAFSPDGFNMDFEAHSNEANGCTSIAAARKRLADAYGAVSEKLKSTPMEHWAVSLPEGPVMGGMPRFAIIAGIVEHTSHHRGALTVYARLLDLVPPMPYM